MKRSDVLNDYQSYWAVLRDLDPASPAGILVPNIMRNILEYYFGFVHKSSSLASKLAELSDKDVDFKAFARYINRESHSDSTNIHDFGVIDSGKYLGMFGRIFEEMKEEDHYYKMIGKKKPKKKIDKVTAPPGVAVKQAGAAVEAK